MGRGVGEVSGGGRLGFQNTSSSICVLPWSSSSLSTLLCPVAPALVHRQLETMKRGAWDGFRMYENATDAYQHFANAHVAAHPRAASTEQAAKAAQEAWNACPASSREQATKNLRHSRGKKQP